MHFNLSTAHSLIFANAHKECRSILKDFSLTVKAATLIFISGRGSAILSAKEGKTGLFIICLRVNKLLGPRKRACIS